MQVVQVDTDDYESCEREILHYAGQYAQDGPIVVRIQEIKPRKKKPQTP